MKIYDAHTHIGEDYFYAQVKKQEGFSLKLKELISSMDKNGVSKSIVCLCPSIQEITCCEPADLILKEGKIWSVCPKCNKVLAKLDHDPYRSYNLGLIKEIKKEKLKDRIIPFFILHLQNPKIEEEIQFFVDNFKDFGFKMHTFSSKTSVLKIKKHFKNIDIPLLIHSGVTKDSNPQDIIDFSKEYSGNILMAHAARLSMDFLKQINERKNLFFDVSPLTSYYKKIINGDFKTILEKPENLEEINLPEDIYNYLLKNSSEDKILFGTDIPWCNTFGMGYEKEINILKNLKISKEIKEKIAFKNFEKFLNI